MKNLETAQQTIPGVPPAPPPPAPGVELEDLLTVARVAHNVASGLRRAGLCVFDIETRVKPSNSTEPTIKGVRFWVYDHSFSDYGKTLVVSFLQSIGGAPGPWYGDRGPRQRNWTAKYRGVSVDWIEAEGAGR